jgi:intracellular sulfur oxidation DsrE/DsrF family protein
MRGIAALLLILGMLATGTVGPVAADEAARRIAIHVDENDPTRMNLALNNARNVFAHYGSQGVPVEIRIVTYGPGLHMLRNDTSPVKDRISAMSLEHDGLSFAACANTRAAMAKNEGKDIPIMAEAEEVPSGVVELVELQEAGWAYLRP